MLPTLLLVAMLLCGLLLAGCGTNAQTKSGKTANPATCGRDVVLHEESNVLFFGYDSYLCTAAVDKEGKVSEFVIEAAMSSRIRSVAVDNGSLYVANDEGIFAFNLSELTSKQATATSTKLCDKKVSSGFQIWDGYLYYVYNGSLYRVPVAGGESTKLHDGIADFDIYDATIYFTTTDKGLYEIPIGGEGVCLATADGADCTIAVSDENIYTLDYKTTAFSRYNFDSKEYTKVDVSPTPAKFSVIFAHNDTLLYMSAGNQVCVANTQDGVVKAPEGTQDFLANKVSSSLAGNRLYTFNSSSHDLTVYDFDTNKAVQYEVDKEMADMLAAAQQGGTASSGSASSSGASGSSASSSASYGISDDWSTAAGYGWKATLPNEWKGVVSATVAKEGKSVIFYVADQEAKGYGGKLVSLIYSNEANPSYPDYEQVHAYGDGNYLYAVYPTDTQYDTSNPGQYPTCKNAIPAFLKSITY